MKKSVVLIGALALGLTLSIALPRLGASDDNDPPERLATATLQPLEFAPVPGAGAASPREAVEGFLAAEAAGRLRLSFSFLSAAERGAYGSPAGWVAEHADTLAPIRAYRVEGVRDREVVTLLELEASLDEVAGLVPARARATWRTVRDGDGWAVDLEASRMEPLFPSDHSAPDAVRAWAEARQGCRSANERSGTLVGFPALAEGLCRTDGPVRVGAVARLLEAESSSLTAAFGGEVTGWARVVPVEGPVPLRAVLAPIGERWTVIGILTP